VIGDESEDGDCDEVKKLPRVHHWFRPEDVSHHGRIQRFLLTELKLKHQWRNIHGRTEEGAKRP